MCVWSGRVALFFLFLFFGPLSQGPPLHGGGGGSRFYRGGIKRRNCADAVCQNAGIERLQRWLAALLLAAQIGPKMTSEKKHSRVVLNLLSALFFCIFLSLSLLQPPVDGFHARLDQRGIGLREVAAPEKAAVRAQAGRVGRLQDGVVAPARPAGPAFACAEFFPQQEDGGDRPGSDRPDGRVRDGLPPFARVRVGGPAPHGEGGVEEEDALARPGGQGAVAGRAGRQGGRQVGRQLLVNVAQGGGDGLAAGDGEGQALRLAGAVVGVLGDAGRARERGERRKCQVSAL